MTCESQFRWTSSARSDTGRVREINEDACLNEPEAGRWAVADGMGGHAVGDVASRTVIDALTQLAAPQGLRMLIADVRARLQFANRQLRDEAARRQVQRIGSTVVVLLACDRFCGYVWAGDSRIYLYRDGQLRQLTRDHSQVEELRSLGVITDEEARNHPAQHMITRAVGATDLLELDDDAIEVADGDVFLLCSDGLSNELSDDEIAGVLTSAERENACGELVDLALARGGRDNITAVVVEAQDPNAADKTLLNPAP
ncbi:protein phosphatase [Paraburkholderia atlantica]|uniref:Protein phosphatase n=1 Tax=Paraburkholderia atlantica TaxID=2654982 RepID=A0A6I1Q806_PARAM|nr:protein phosphatase 2C domain-containing protein [Paraburkholderia atlantica]MBB5421059.1 protein phosphatase [Paraburkholderia atlantica]MBB5423294.1 protein phosphatase [Paraburkholderia atlantica]MPW10455.1 SpoIIE family protein phosphatase [Paraburkholderia atlantica]NUY34617.1 serine/threonine-protein phosphatase [Paraburkholderia atlantica]